MTNNSDLGDLINDSKIRRLNQILSKYKNIFKDGNTEREVLEAFKFEKPATSIEFRNGDSKKIQSLIDELEELFFVSHAYIPPDKERQTSQDVIFVSRIEYLDEILKYFTEKFEGNYDAFAGVAGLLLKYSPKEIAPYCTSERMKDLEIIKY
jgi:hypothetical protein